MPGPSRSGPAGPDAPSTTRSRAERRRSERDAGRNRGARPLVLATAAAVVAGGVTAGTAVLGNDFDDALSSGLAVTTGAYRSAYREALTGSLARTAQAPIRPVDPA